jgi:hypothetical protein
LNENRLKRPPALSKLGGVIGVEAEIELVRGMPHAILVHAAHALDLLGER